MIILVRPLIECVQRDGCGASVAQPQPIWKAVAFTALTCTLPLAHVNTRAPFVRYRWLLASLNKTLMDPLANASCHDCAKLTDYTGSHPSW